MKPELINAAARGVVAAAILLLGGCVADNSGSNSKPTIGPPPSEPRPGGLFMATNLPDDSDGNGYPDTFVVTVYIFDQSPYPRSVAIAGSFEFRLVNTSGEVVRAWRIPPETARRAQISAAPGPGYTFRMSLLEDGGTDRLPKQSVDVIGAFTSMEGQRVQAKPNTLSIGR
ncbi:MAG: hypothetical protein KF864_10865 [Phycisphaeraceae bacterium]|nr:hypothetical protein [Phycisphaeraceae bacterium]